MTLTMRPFLHDARTGELHPLIGIVSATSWPSVRALQAGRMKFFRHHPREAAVRVPDGILIWERDVGAYGYRNVMLLTVTP